MPSLGGGGSLLLLLAIVDREDATESVDTMNTIITQRVLWHIIIEMLAGEIITQKIGHDLVVWQFTYDAMTSSSNSDMSAAYLRYSLALLQQ